MADRNQPCTTGLGRVPLADACVTEWRYIAQQFPRNFAAVPLADACVTEWRFADDCGVTIIGKVPLADACVTEWRNDLQKRQKKSEVPLADACVTEWRRMHFLASSLLNSWCHSLMPVLLNGGLDASPAR